MAASLPNSDFESAVGKDRRVNGLFMVDNNFLAPGGRWRMIGGEVALDAVATTEGQPVSGSLHLKILQLTDGNPPKK